MFFTDNIAVVALKHQLTAFLKCAPKQLVMWHTWTNAIWHQRTKPWGLIYQQSVEKVLYFVLIFTHISTYKYKLVDHTICVKLCVITLYAHICAYALLINEGPGSKGTIFELNITANYLTSTQELKMYTFHCVPPTKIHIVLEDHSFGLLLWFSPRHLKSIHFHWRPFCLLSFFTEEIKGYSKDLGMA